MRRGSRVLTTVLVLLVPAVAVAGESWLGANPDGYGGGRGNITVEGPSGMFLNPTSGTLGQGEAQAQYCVATIEVGGGKIVGHNAFAALGLTDWLEVGGIGYIVDVDQDDFFAGAPFARIRLLRDEAWLPELSVGGILREGDDALVRRTAFVTASKLFDVDGAGPLPGIRPHGGFRQVWQDDDVNEETGSVGYVGGEILLPKHTYFVGEVSNKADLVPFTPYSFGIQVRHPSGFGFSLAGLETGLQGTLGVFVGIGVSYM